jgi:hypothetical protein
MRVVRRRYSPASRGSATSTVVRERIEPQLAECHAAYTAGTVEPPFDALVVPPLEAVRTTLCGWRRQPPPVSSLVRAALNRLSQAGP